jgi:hypothetical protein
MLQESQGEIWDTEALLQEATFYCASTDPADLCPKADSWEQRGLTLYTLASRLQKRKARSDPHMVMFNSVGYFTLVLRNFPLPSVTWPCPHSNSSGFISLLSIPTSLLLSQNSGLVCFLLLLLPATRGIEPRSPSIWALMLILMLHSLLCWCATIY